MSQLLEAKTALILGVANVEMPATPERVWKTIQDAKAQHTM